VPVWVLTAVLYIIFALIAGAGEKIGEQAEGQVPQKAGFESAAGKLKADERAGRRSDSGKDPVLWASGIIAAAALLTCFILPIWVFVTGGSRYEQNFATFKNILIWPTLIYFVAGTTWAVKRNKAD